MGQANEPMNGSEVKYGFQLFYATLLELKSKFAIILILFKLRYSLAISKVNGMVVNLIQDLLLKKLNIG